MFEFLRTAVRYIAPIFQVIEPSTNQFANAVITGARLKLDF